MTRYLYVFVAIVCVGIMGMSGARAVALAQGFDTTQKKEIEAIIRQYLMDNPTILVEVADKHNADQQAQADARAVTGLKARYKEIFANPAYAVLGGKNAPVPVVEFFDYNCGYCKQAYAELVQATKNNPKVKVVLIDTPILGPSSELAARWAIAAGMMGKYLEFHGALMTFQGPKTEVTLAEMAKQVGLDSAALKAKADSAEVSEQLARNMATFHDLGLNFTPAFAAPDRIIRGAMTPEVLNQISKEILDKK
jgi:protein-disulfide isomerase